MRSATADGDAQVTYDARVSYAVQVPDTLVHVLSLSAGAGAAVCLSVATALGRAYHDAYVVEDVALLEEVTGTARHRFSLVEAAGLEMLPGVVGDRR